MVLVFNDLFLKGNILNSAFSLDDFFSSVNSGSDNLGLSGGNSARGHVSGVGVVSSSNSVFLVYGSRSTAVDIVSGGSGSGGRDIVGSGGGNIVVGCSVSGSSGVVVGRGGVVGI